MRSTRASPSAPPGTACSSEDEPGYGFVDEETPELAIAVVPSRRGRGLGKEMLEALLARAREDGFRRLSLSVENDNPAIGLYESYGFRTVDKRGNRRPWSPSSDLAASRTRTLRPPRAVCDRRRR